MEKIKNFFKSTGALFKTNTGNMIFVVVASLILGGMLFGGSSGEESTKQIQNDNASVTVSDQAVTENQQKEASAETTPTEKQITKYAAGAYKIGADMPAGVYVVYANGSGYLCISNDSNQEDIINNDIFCGNRYIEVTDGQYLSLSSAYAISIADYVPIKTPATISDGMYLVGTDIPAGEYKVTADSGSGYWAIYNKPIGTSDIVDNDLFEASSYVTVKDGQYLCVSGGSFVVE